MDDICSAFSLANDVDKCALSCITKYDPTAKLTLDAAADAEFAAMGGLMGGVKMETNSAALHCIVESCIEPTMNAILGCPIHPAPPNPPAPAPPPG